MFGFRFDRYGWVHFVLASGSLGVGGCVDRAYDFGFIGGGDSEGDTEGTGTTGPIDPTSPTNPSAPTTDPTNPTDPIDPTGYMPGIPGPPQLIDIRFLNNLTIELVFSEVMASPDLVDPTQFRLSLAFGSNEPYKYGQFTFYQELGYFNGPEYCYEYCYDPCKYDPECEYGRMCYENCYTQMGPPVHGFSLVLDPGAPDRIRLGLDNGISSGVCAALGQSGPQVENGLFLHFTDDMVPVTDAQGEPFAPIGETWALMPQSYSYYRPEFFPEMDPFLPIPCPF